MLKMFAMTMNTFFKQKEGNLYCDKLQLSPRLLVLERSTVWLCPGHLGPGRNAVSPVQRQLSFTSSQTRPSGTSQTGHLHTGRGQCTDCGAEKRPVARAGQSWLPGQRKPPCCVIPSGGAGTLPRQPAGGGTDNSAGHLHVLSAWSTFVVYSVCQRIERSEVQTLRVSREKKRILSKKTFLAAPLKGAFVRP